MNKIDKLLKELCPNGVEWKELGEVCDFQRGRTITQKSAIDGDVPVIAGGQQPAYYHNTFNRTGETIAVSGVEDGELCYWIIGYELGEVVELNKK